MKADTETAIAKFTQQTELVKTLQAQIAAKDEELARFKDFDPAAMREQIASLTESLNSVRADKDSQISGWETNHATLTAENAKQRTALENSFITTEMSAAIARKKGDPAMLLPFATKYARLEETPEGYRTHVVDESGIKRMNVKGEPVTFDEFVSETLIPRFGKAFAGTGSSGSGAGRSINSSGDSRRTVSMRDGKDFVNNLQGIIDGSVRVKTE